MKFTLSWLKDHLETNASLSEITQKLNTLGLEVESVEDPAEKFKGFIVAEVVEVTRHPNADRLSLCYATTGNNDRVQVVCGASNVRQGMKVAFAPIGVTIPATGTVLKKGKIRDVESLGMFCSGQELGFSEESEGILDLESSLKPGTSLIDALNLADPIIDVAITPNRSDCFGIRGIARDLAAGGLGVLKPLAYTSKNGDSPCPIKVTIADTQACPEFQVRVIRGVRNGPSPDWIQRRLQAIGLRPISALVDVTNYLTYDLGRPLHVFDLGKIQGDLTIRLSKEGETLLALNGKNYTLKEGMTVIADTSGVLSLGGIIGGESSACQEDTTDVLIECASFDPVRTAHTGRKLSIISDARTRFERGVDPMSVRSGLDAATDLIQQWCGGTPSEVYKAPSTDNTSLLKKSPITLHYEKLKSLSGCDIPLEEARKYLEALGFEVTDMNTTSLTTLPPSYRPDIDGPADLIEEILRLKGYDDIPAVPLPPLHPISSNFSAVSIIKRALAARGLHEVVTWSFMQENIALKFGKEAPSLRITNPISVDLNFMRPSIIPNLLQTAIRNQDRGQNVISLFEVGPQFEPNQQLLIAAGLLTGQTGPRHWSQTPRLADVFDGKAHVLAALAAMGVPESSLQIEPSGPEYYHPGRKGTLKQGNQIFAFFGEVHPLIVNELGGEGPFVGFEIFIERLPPLRTKKTPLHLSPYQPVVRDFAFVVDQQVPADQVINAVAKADRSLITQVHIFDVYTGEKLEKGKKSLAIQVRLEPQAGTLTEAQITEVSDKIISNVAKTTGGALRSL
ncbi:MAG: phenylalanine--tRNA ligase subunit beta [Alphaproteobacteria bacterium]|nr:phenylalanine--tRNA ligase subunit beta [Alphaproteobacteria bacterium]